MANTLYSFDGGNPANQNQTIAPGIAPAGVTPPTESADTVVITSTGGNGTIQGFTVDSAAGNDTVSLNGSPNLTQLTLGTGNDILNIATVILGGSITSSNFAGAEGNDTFNILANGVGASATFFGGGNGADLFNLQGNYSNVTVAGGADRDFVQFTAAGTSFTDSLFVLGAGDDTVRDQFFGLDVSGTTVEGGGGDDEIDFQASTVGTGASGLSVGGGFGDDFILGTVAGENTVLAGGDDDYVQTFAGNDSVGGGAGVDTIFVGKGADFAFGGGGSDLIFGQFGQNTLSGGNGIDIVVGGINDDLIFGNAEFENDQGDDTLIGGIGDDTAVASSGDTWIFGDGVNALQSLFTPFTPGIDWRVASLGGNTADYTVGNGLLNRVTIVPATAASVVALPDLGQGITSSTAFWLAANPDIASGLGNVSIDSLTKISVDILEQGADIDNLLVANTPGINPATGAYVPFLAPQLGNDSLQGNSGNDVIFGGELNAGAGQTFLPTDFQIDQDTIEGNGGNDVIMGNRGADSMSGGFGNDLFLQEVGSSNTVAVVQSGDNYTLTFTGLGIGPDRVDVITDFKAADSIGGVVDSLSFQGWGGVVSNNIGSATGQFGANDVVLYSGIYDRVAGTFVTTDNVAGPDVLAFRATNAAKEGAAFAADFGDQAVVLLGASDEAFSVNNFI